MGLWKTHHLAGRTLRFLLEKAAGDGPAGDGQGYGLLCSRAEWKRQSWACKGNTPRRLTQARS